MSARHFNHIPPVFAQSVHECPTRNSLRITRFKGDCLIVGADAAKWITEIHLPITLNQYLLAVNAAVINNDILKSPIHQRKILFIHYRIAVTENKFWQKNYGLFWLLLNQVWTIPFFTCQVLLFLSTIQWCSIISKSQAEVRILHLCVYLVQIWLRNGFLALNNHNTSLFISHKIASNDRCVWSQHSPETPICCFPPVSLLFALSSPYVHEEK